MSSRSALEEEQEGLHGRGSQGEWEERRQEGWLRGQIPPWLAKHTASIHVPQEPQDHTVSTDTVFADACALM